MDEKFMKLAQDAITFEKHLTIGARTIEEARSLCESTATASLSRAIEEASRTAAESMSMSGLLKLEEDSGIRQLLKTIDQSKELERIALGPWADLQRVRNLIPDLVESPLQRKIERIHQSMAALEIPRFLLPEISQVERLIAEIRINQPSDTLMKYFESESKLLQQAINSMRTPWLDAHEALRSITGFAELQGIGHALSTISAFDEVLVSALRSDLGDWRDHITWPSEMFTDLSVRSNFYYDLGFNRALTNFPQPAFEESLHIAGLRRESPPAAHRYGRPEVRSIDSDEEEARTTMAYVALHRLETQLRRFIDEQMTRAFGTDWPKHRLPKELHEKWQEKKKRAETDKEWPLIAYADFTDYESVICQRDNWREVFATFYNRPESVRESLQRLYPIRLDTMHSRTITKDDELLLRVETKRLIKVTKS